MFHFCFAFAFAFEVGKWRWGGKGVKKKNLGIWWILVRRKGFNGAGDWGGRLVSFWLVECGIRKRGEVVIYSDYGVDFD